MKKLTLILLSTTFVLSGFALTGCAVTTAGIKKGDERNFVRTLNDVSAGRAIKARMLRAQDVDLGGVDVEVAQGIVLLSGNVPDPKLRIEAERIAWSAPHVTEIGNEIKIKSSQGIVRNAKDGLLNKSVKARLIAKGDVKARNFNVETHDGIVYLLGVARSKEELAKAAQIASTTRGTREVISYVRVVEGFEPEKPAVQNYPQYQTPAQSMPSAEYNAPAPQYRSLPKALSAAPTPMPSMPTPQYRSLPKALSAAPAPSEPAQGEPIYRDPKTGEIIELAPGTKTIPYRPNASPAPLANSSASASSGAAVVPPQISGVFPSDEDLGKYRVGTPGEAVMTIESAPYYVDPETGKEIPVNYLKNRLK